MLLCITSGGEWLTENGMEQKSKHICRVTVRYNKHKRERQANPFAITKGASDLLIPGGMPFPGEFVDTFPYKVGYTLPKISCNI